MHWLEQSQTYADLMMGSPNADSNDNQLVYACEPASRLPGSFGRPYLIPPRRRPYAVEPGDMDGVLARNKDFSTRTAIHSRMAHADPVHCQICLPRDRS